MKNNKIKKKLHVLTKGSLLNINNIDYRSPCKINVNQMDDMQILSLMKFHGIEDFAVIIHK
jgi:hypothetical protein